MADDRKYYYMRLKEGFFNDESMILLESMPDGYIYSNILLKMYLASLKSEGRLMFNNIIPYNAQMIATITRHQVGTVEKALEIFKSMGLIEVLDNGAIYMMNIQNFIGKSTEIADRQREYDRRITAEKKSLRNLTENFKESVGEIEIKKEIEKKKERKSKTVAPLESVMSDSDLTLEVKYTIYDFIEMRKLIKAPMTDRAITLMIKKLKDMASDPETQIAILNQSIENSWKGIFPLRESKPGNGLKNNWNINRDITQQSQEKQTEEQGDIYSRISRQTEGVYFG